MSHKRLLFTLIGLIILLVSVSGAVAQEPAPPAPNQPQAAVGTITSTSLSTGFTYQGRLNDGGNLANGFYGFQFKLYDAAIGGSQVGDVITVERHLVADGLFTVKLDFGSDVFNGDARYLEIGVRPGGSSAPFTTLSPRQELTPAPYALALPGLWTQPNAASPNLIGGYSGNSVALGVTGATIGGGGSSGSANQVTDHYATVGGGKGNVASNFAATVSGGLWNTAGGTFATIGGGPSNTTNGFAATIGGGAGNQATADYATIAGGGASDPADYGTGNRVTDNYGTVSGGGNNQAGNANADLADAIYATVGGGEDNTARSWYSTVSGGWHNRADYSLTTIGGGLGNTASGDTATVAGGYYNTASGSFTTVPGGYVNTASGFAATVAGGSGNTATSDYSFAAGHRAQANHQGTFVWGDSTDADVASTGNDQFVVRASGGVWFYSNSSATAGVNLAAGSGSWASLSDRDAKTNFELVDGRDILARLATVPITTWNYKSQAPSVRHIGPMAQDFYATFGLGEDDKHISTVDADGVALAAIQGLYQAVQEKDAQIAAQQKQIEMLEARLATLEQTVAGNPIRTSGLPALWLFLGGLTVAGLALERQRRTGGRP